MLNKHISSSSSSLLHGLCVNTMLYCLLLRPILYRIALFHRTNITSDDERRTETAMLILHRRRARVFYSLLGANRDSHVDPEQTTGQGVLRSTWSEQRQPC